MHRVLIVDDEPHIRLLLEETLDVLEPHGVEVEVATNGADALAMLERDPHQVVILDVMMPRLNGFEVCRRIKDDPRLQGTYVILLTAKGKELDRALGEEMGADLYLTKPFDPDEVLRRTARALSLELP